MRRPARARGGTRANPSRELCLPSFLHAPSPPHPRLAHALAARTRSAEYTKVASRTALGFVVMGFVGFFVKLIFIPINNIIGA